MDLTPQEVAESDLTLERPSGLTNIAVGRPSKIEVAMRDRDGRMRWAHGVILTLGILLSVYLASPLIALHSIASAVESKDAVAL